MADTTAAAQLQTLKQAATTWFARQRRDLNGEWDFLDQIQSARGGAMSLQDANADGAADILANSISEYLGKPPSPPGT
jgi:hypothetical protein